MLITAPAGRLEPIQLSGIKGAGLNLSEVNPGLSDSFSGVVDMVSKGINKVSAMQAEADKGISTVASGDVSNLHDVVIAVQEASLAFQFAVNVRNKVVESYQEVMRMQV